MTDTPADTGPRIVATEDGPLEVSGVTRMTLPGNVAATTEPVMYLCRCGQSRSKPFCDGSHNAAGFRGEGGEPAGVDRVFAFRGETTTVTFNPRLCAHAAECLRLAPEVFDVRRKPWILPDNGGIEDIAAAVRACPSGALKITQPEDLGPDQYPDRRAEIVVQRNGPYWVFDIPPPAPLQGKGMTPRKYVLCRCGLSGTKPFCDGTHHDRRWRDSDT